MSKIRFDVYTWIQKLPTAVYTFNGHSAQGGTETLLKVIPVNDNIAPLPVRQSVVTFTLSRWLLAFILMLTGVIGLAFAILLIFFFTHA